MEDLKLNAPPENALVKETLSSVRGSPKKGIFRDHPLKPRLKRSSLKGKIRVRMEKGRYMQTIEASKDKKSKKAKLIEELTQEDGSECDICMQNTWNPKKKKVETNSTKEENKEV